MEPASIRYNNPGAMWGGSALARKWGATKTVGLNDDLGQGNNIAVFPTKVRGAAAQFDLWHTSALYHNKTLLAAITKWSGGNWVPSYTKFLRDRVPGLENGTVISDAYMASDKGVAFCKAQAWHEAGKPYPMSDAEWREAQKLVHGPNAVKLPNPTKIVLPTQTAPAVAASAGLGIGAIIAIAAVALIIGFIVWRVLNNKAMNKLDEQIAAAEVVLATAKPASPPSPEPQHDDEGTFIQ